MEFRARSTQGPDRIAEAERFERAGRLAEAEAVYRSVLGQDSHAASALIGLASIALAVGRGATARLLVERAAGRAPEAALWNELAARRFTCGDVAGARLACVHAIVLDPGNANYLYHLGVTQRSADAHDAAIKSLSRAAQIMPTHPFALSDLAVLWQVTAEFGAAEAALRRLLALDPSRTAGWHNLGLLMAGRDQPAREAVAYRRAIAVDPGFIAARYNAGCLALGQRRYAGALHDLKTTLALAPDHSQAWNNLGCALREQGWLEPAVRAFRRGHLGDGDDLTIVSNIAMSLTVVDGAQADQFIRGWGERFPMIGRRRHRNPGARLRVGYISPDMRHHSCAYFLEPLLAAHDRGAVEVFAYADVSAPDATTRRLEDLSERWLNIARQDDRTVIERIVADDLDILVDLAGHTSGNRLGVFAARPAAIQVSWLGYNATTGLRQIDWKLCDRWSQPSAEAEWFAERLWPLDRAAHCWRPPADAPDIAPERPSGGPIVFGSFNALHKLSTETLVLWAQILKLVPGATLRLKGGAGSDADTRRRIISILSAEGIAAERVMIENWATSTESHLSRYDAIDVALDPFPYNGTTTTCEALWMGVPVVTLAGNRMLSRIGASLMGALDLTEWIAADHAAYADIASRLARAGMRDRASRLALRARMASSDLRDESGFARALEEAYRRMAERGPRG